MVRRLVACLNGTRQPGSHPALPLAPAELAAATLAVLDAGATEVHVHPRDSSGTESLEPADVAAAVTAIRAAAPGVPVSVTTRLLPGTGAERRAELVAGWTVPPELASVNMHEPGSPELARILAGLGVGVEAGVWTPAAARLLTGVPQLAARCRYILIEPMDADVDAALATAHAVRRGVLDEAGVALPRLLHGEGGPAWGVFDAAAAAGLDVRMGLEDTMTGRSGEPVTGNVALIKTAVAGLGSFH